jgi:hypothetical protein
MTYTVSYKKLDSFFWRDVKKVKGDFIATDVDAKPRVLILEDETRLEIPTKDVVFKFSKERFIVIKQNMEKESGQQINV